MSVKNTRQKGRAFVKIIIARLEEYGLKSYEVSGSGAGLTKGDIRIDALNLVIEAKDHKQISVAQWVEQSEKEGLGVNKTALFWRHPKSPSSNPDIRVDISLEYFAKLLKKNSEPMIKEPDREMKYRLKNLGVAVKQVEKYLPE